MEAVVAIVDEVGLIVRQPQLGWVYGEEGQRGEELTPIWEIGVGQIGRYGGRDLTLRGSRLWGRSGGAKLVLDDLRRADGWDEGILGLYDDAVLEGRGDLEAVLVLYSGSIARDTCYSPPTDIVEEANLYADAYILRIIHWDK